MKAENGDICSFRFGLVSIMIPCYNGARFLPRMLDSICRQTYPYIQIIFVNDGSVDETEKVFQSYIPLFHDIGIRYNYIRQDNQGQAEAINSALPYVEGEYMMWVDADDYLTENHVGKKVECLSDNKDASIVCCKGAIVEESNIEHVTGYLDNQHLVGELFENILFERARCTPGLYMIRTLALFDALSGKKIYPSRVGQNFQLLLPVCNKYKTCQMNEILFYYVARSDSHSHNIHGILQWCERFHDIKDLKIRILHEMEGKLSEEYMCLLCRLVCLQESFQKIDMILNHGYEEEENVCIREEVKRLYKYFANRGKGRQYWIWGFCDKNRKLKQYLEKYAGVTVAGFIDSDRTKWNGTDVVSPENIDIKEMYLIILLRDHSDISERLRSCGLRMDRDVFYPEFEISENLKTAGCTMRRDDINEESRNRDISFCG